MDFQRLMQTTSLRMQGFRLLLYGLAIAMSKILVEPTCEILQFFFIGFSLTFEVWRILYLFLRIFVKEKWKKKNPQQQTREKCKCHCSLSNVQSTTQEWNSDKCQCPNTILKEMPTRSPCKTRKSCHMTKNLQLQVHCVQYATILASQLNDYYQHVDFDPDGSTVVVDNSANAHIINDKNLFVGDILELDGKTGVATIGGTDHKPSGIGDIKLSWKDDEGKSRSYVLHNALYFPDLPVNILSITRLADHFQDNEGTYIKTM